MQKVISVVLTGNATSLRAALVGAARDVEHFDGSVDKAGQTGSRTANLLASGFKIAAASIAIALAAAVFSAAQFETRMRNVNSISALSEEAFAGLSSKVLDLSRDLPQSANNLAEGLYEIASSGFQGAAGLEVLEHSARAASAGLTDTKTSAKAIVGVLNAYGLAASDAARVSDVLFQTVNLGVISFEELSQNLGDVIGLAAAAGVSIEEVGAAIAAITLAGVPAAEAFTGLNNLTKSLIKPSDELSTVYRALGINITRDLKDPAIGLRGVMEQLRTATGGNVEAFLALFPEIRAARAAFALAANDGENYARTTEGITDKQKTAGATMRAFNEQMKAVSNQAKVFWNEIQAAGIELGTHLLPVISDTLSALRQLGSDAVPGLKAGLAALAPFFIAVAQVGGDLVDIAAQLVENLGPAAKAIAGLVAIGVITSLNLLAEGISAISGFLADHPALVTGVVVAYTAWVAVTKALALLQLAQTFAATSQGLAGVTTGMRILTGATTTATGRLLLLKGSLAALGIGAVILALGAAFVHAQKVKKGVDEFVGSLSQNLDLSSIDGLRTHLARLRGEYAELAREVAKGNIGEGDLKSLKALKAAAQDSAAALGSLAANVAEVSSATGLSEVAVQDLAKVLEVDLTKGYDASAGAREKIISHYDQLVKTAHGSGEAAKAAATLSIEALEEQAAAAEELAKKVTEAFAGATDIVKGFSADVAKEKGLGGFLEENLKAAREFAAGIQEAAAKGLDPSIIAKLLQAGPEAAAPFLQAIAADHSGNLVALANETEGALAEINTKVVAFARVTQQAVNSVDDKKIGMLGEAMRITAEIFDKEGARTAEAISTKLGIPLERVTTVAREFGITMGATGPPIVDAADAADIFATSLDKLPALLAQNGRSLDETTEAGRRNRGSIEDIVAKAQDHVHALASQGATMDQQRGAFDRHMADLRGVLRDAGYTEAQIDSYVASLHLIPPTKRTDVQVTGEAAVASVMGALRNLFGMPSTKTVTVITRNVAIGAFAGAAGAAAADGGVFHYFAAGGFENHVAQVAPKGVTRIWNEPETEGEGYIPYARSKRGRSTAVLATIASDFGYDLVPRQTQVRYANGAPGPMSTTGGASAAIDYRQLGRAVATELAPLISRQRPIHQTFNEKAEPLAIAAALGWELR